MRRDEDGFTLMEMVLATGLLTMVVGTIAMALVLYLRATEETTDRLAESPEAQIASVYLTRDAQSSVAAYDNRRCAQDVWNGQAHLASFGWRDPGAETGIDDDEAVVVSYVLTGSPQRRLVRYACTAALDTPGSDVPSTIASSSTTDTQTLVALVDPSTTTTASVTTSTVAVSLDICTTESDAAVCKHGSSLPFDLSVTRRVA